MGAQLGCNVGLDWMGKRENISRGQGDFKRMCQSEWRGKQKSIELGAPGQKCGEKEGRGKGG